MKNKLYYFIIPVVLLILFFVVIYKSDGKKNKGGVDITIALAKDSLSEDQKDSLLTNLVDLYDSKEKDSYSFVNILLKGKEDKEVDIPKSAVNKIRSIFSNSFYTYEDRKADIQTFLTNYKGISENYRKNIDFSGNAEDKDAYMIYFGSFKNPAANQANSVSMLKAKIKVYIQLAIGKKIVVCSSSPKNNPNPKSPGGGDGEIVNIDNGGNNDANNGGNNGGNKVGTNGGNKVGTGEAVEPTQTLGVTTITCNLENNVNVIRFSNSADGATYDYTITCESGCTGDNYSKTGSTSVSELYLDLHSEYEAIKLRTFKIVVVTRLGKQTKTSTLTGVKLKCKK
jgi:hypothetical protein